MRYENDSLGRRTARVDTTPFLTVNNAFGYNVKSEVTSATMANGESIYDYDSIGNRLFAALGAATNSYTANALNQYSSIIDPVNTVNPVYDLDGNIITNGVWSFRWDAENRMVAAYSNDTLLVVNVYDDQSRRITKSVFEITQSGTNAIRQFSFLYDGWNPIREIRSQSSEVSTNYYCWGTDLSGTMQGAGGVGGLLAVYTVNEGTTSTYYPCYDANGNITAYVDELGIVRAEYAYDAFGQTISQGGDMASAFSHRFSTKYADDETGLYYYGYRFYAPGLGRWVSRDPIEEEGGANVYGFVGNRPIELLDCLGLKWRISRKGESTAVATCDCNDTIETLAQKIHLDADEYLKWLQKSNGTLPSSKSEKIKAESSYLIPNEVHITQGNLDPNYGVFEVYSKTTSWKESVTRSYNRWWSFQRYKVIDHWTEATNGRSDGNAFSEITGALSGPNIAIWLHFGHGGTRLINGTRYGGNLQVGSPPAQRGPANFGPFKHHSLEMVTLYTCCAGIKGDEWAKALVAPKKYGAVLYASPETVSQGKWGPLKEAYYNE